MCPADANLACLTTVNLNSEAKEKLNEIDCIPNYHTDLQPGRGVYVCDPCE